MTVEPQIAVVILGLGVVRLVAEACSAGGARAVLRRARVGVGVLVGAEACVVVTVSWWLWISLVPKAYTGGCSGTVLLLVLVVIEGIVGGIVL